MKFPADDSNDTSKNDSVPEQPTAAKPDPTNAAPVNPPSNNDSVPKQPGPAKAPEKSNKKPLLDLTKYRGANTASTEGDTSIGTQTNIPVKKPGKKNYFRIHPDPSYRLYDVGVIEEEGGDVYLVNADLQLPDDVMQFVSHVNLLTAVTHRGKLFVWYFKNTDTSWASSALRVARRAQDEWVRILADFESGGYTILPPPSEPLRSKKPVFPSMSPEEIFTLAFDNRMITSVDDPIIRRLRGLE